MSEKTEQGGDPACWSHLFDDERAMVTTADLTQLSASATTTGPIWTMQSADLNANLIRLGEGDAIQEHVNNECDVLIIGMSGEGLVTINGLGYPLLPGTLILVERGATRAINPTEPPLTYLTTHKRRAPLMPVTPDSRKKNLQQG